MSDSGTKSSDTPQLDPANYSKLSDIFRSWFWRYYDHLFHLMIYNLGWFLTCLAIGWLARRLSLIGTLQNINWAGIYFVYLVECVVSVGWAFIVFRIFSAGGVFLSEVWPGILEHLLKAVGVAAISGLVIGLGIYNLNFYFSLQTPIHFIHLLLMGFVLSVLTFWLSMALYQWPILFFQNPPFLKIFYRSFILTVGGGPVSLGLLFFMGISFLLFVFKPFLWFFIGMVFFFSLQTVALEKLFLRYKITYGDRPIEELLESLERERQRGWRDFFKPWETR